MNNPAIKQIGIMFRLIIGNTGPFRSSQLLSSLNVWRRIRLSSQGHVFLVKDMSFFSDVRRGTRFSSLTYEEGLGDDYTLFLRFAKPVL